MQKTKTKKTVSRKAQKNGGRRYPAGEEPAYDQVYEKKKKQSYILNENVRKSNIETAFSLAGITECKGTLHRLVGDEDGYYRDENERSQKAALPIAKQKLGRVYKKYKLWQEQQIKKGNSLEKPEHWPDDLRTECLKAQGLYDLRRLEKHFIESRIEELKDQAGETEEPTPILPEGPVCDLKIQEWERQIVKHQTGTPQKRNVRVDKPVSVDGQQISFSPTGIPYIDCEDSPFHDMPLASYKQMSKQWLKEHRIYRMALVKRMNERNENLGEDEREIHSVDSFKDFLKQNDKWPSNPDWPDDAKPITKIIEEKSK